MIVTLSLPALVRALPPRCAMLKQVLCTATARVDVPELSDDEAPVVARWQSGLRPEGMARFAEGRFLRPVSLLAAPALPYAGAMLLGEGYLVRAGRNLIEDEQRNEVTYNEHTWPSKTARSQLKTLVLDEVLAFERVDERDVGNTWREIEAAVAKMRVCQGMLWIESGEPCYVLSRVGKTLGYAPSVTYSDRLPVGEIETLAMSAVDGNTARTVMGEVGRAVSRVDPPPFPEIEVVDPSPFTDDFAQRSFLSLGHAASLAIAEIWSREDRDLRAGYLAKADILDVDVWNGMRKALAEGEERNDVTAEAEDAIFAGLELWERLGGANNVRRNYVSAEQCRVWRDAALDLWKTRTIDIRAEGLAPRGR